MNIKTINHASPSKKNGTEDQALFEELSDEQLSQVYGGISTITGDVYDELGKVYDKVYDKVESTAAQNLGGEGGTIVGQTLAFAR